MGHRTDGMRIKLFYYFLPQHQSHKTSLWYFKISPPWHLTNTYTSMLEARDAVIVQYSAAACRDKFLAF